MNLIIVESPTKATTLGRFLGDKYRVDSTKGHIKDLPKSKLGVDLENDFAPDYRVVDRQKSVVSALKSKAKGVDVVYIATDPDREGEAIAAHVAEILAKENIVRIVFHEITKDAVETALDHPGKINENLVHAQIARRVLDRLVGYSLSPVLWKKVRRGLSAGRVQSVATRLIVEKEEEINKFKPRQYWEIFAQFRKFSAKLINEKVENKTQADKILGDLRKANYQISGVKKREINKSPYPPFTTSTMTQTAARNFGWSAKRTMRVAQRLYEEGLITYHRTDSLNLNLAAVRSARDYIEKKYGKNYLSPKTRFYKTTNKSAQEAHEAIRPTDINKNAEDINSQKDISRLYDLIWKRFTACQMKNALYNRTTIDVKANPGSYLLRTTGQKMEFDGWRKIFPDSSNKETCLPNVEEGQKISLVKTWGEQKFTQPPSRYNEASLIKTLEKLGIGRPSTYAPIISTIQARAYVEKKEGRFYPTPVGVAVTKFLLDNFEKEVDYGFTAGMEESLDAIANGKLAWQRMMGGFWKPFDKMVQKVTKDAKRVKIETESLGKKCPACFKEGRKGKQQGELVIQTGRFGKFVSCSLFPKCKYTDKYMEKIGIACPQCKKGDVIIKKTSKGKKFYGCSSYPKCKWASWRKPKKENS